MAATFPVSIRVDASVALGPLKPIHRFFGADEPNYAYMTDGRKLLSELGRLGPHQTYFRAHNLLTTGDGTPALKWGSTNAYTEDEKGDPVYDWSIVDRIFDAYLERHVKPYVQIGFMPQVLSREPVPYRHHFTPEDAKVDIYTGWAFPPKDYAKWGELVYRWTRHCVERYGEVECESWYWETWNEPNIGYWQGTAEEFYKLHDCAVEGVRRALPGARVGGPETAGGAGDGYLKGFLEHCVKREKELDFVSFHAKGSPVFLEAKGHVRMGIAEQLRDIDGAFEVIKSFPELKGKPVVIGESDPEGCAAAKGPQLGYRNGTMYSSYTAASFARKHDLAAKHGVNLEGALTWAFEFEDQPFFAGFRVLSTNGIDLPVMNVFRMFGKMSGERVEARSSNQVPLAKVLKEGIRGDADVGSLACLSEDGKRVCVMVWHYHDDDVEGPAAEVDLKVDGVPEGWGDGVGIRHWRVDWGHSNAFDAWKWMGSPKELPEEERKWLEAKGKLEQVKGEKRAEVDDGRARIEFELPRQGVSLVVLEG